MDSASLADHCAALLISVRRADRPLSLLCGPTAARPIRLSPGSGCCWCRCRPVARRTGVMLLADRFTLPPPCSSRSSRRAGFMSRGFRLEDTNREAPRGLDCIIPLMALAMYWCGQTWQGDANCKPIAAEKMLVSRLAPSTGVSTRAVGIAGHDSNWSPPSLARCCPRTASARVLREGRNFMGGRLDNATALQQGSRSL